MSVRYLSVDQVKRTHHQLMLDEGFQSILGAPKKLEAAVLRPQSSAFGEDAYPTLAEKAAALLESLAIGHPFMDGNQAIAFTAADTFLRLNGVIHEMDENVTYAFVVEVASGTLKGVEPIAARLRELYAPDLDER